MVEEIFELGNTTKSRCLGARVEAEANGKEVWFSNKLTNGRQCSDWQQTLSEDKALTDFYSIINHEDQIVPNTIRKLDTLLTYAHIAIWLELPSSSSHKNNRKYLEGRGKKKLYVVFPYKHVMAFLSRAETTYIFPLSSNLSLSFS